MKVEEDQLLEAFEEEGGIVYTLHPTPYTLHPTPHTLHPTPYTLQPTPHTLHPTPYTLRWNRGRDLSQRAHDHCKTFLRQWTQRLHRESLV